MQIETPNRVVSHSFSLTQLKLAYTYCKDKKSFACQRARAYVSAKTSETPRPLCKKTATRHLYNGLSINAANLPTDSSVQGYLLLEGFGGGRPMYQLDKSISKYLARDCIVPTYVLMVLGLKVVCVFIQSTKPFSVVLAARFLSLHGSC